jgi:hypothetical protein
MATAFPVASLPVTTRRVAEGIVIYDTIFGGALGWRQQTPVVEELHSGLGKGKLGGWHAVGRIFRYIGSCF